VANAGGECITVPDSLFLAFSNQAAMGALGGIVCFLLTHEILSTRQNMLAGLKEVRDTERSEHTTICPVGSQVFPYPPHLLTTLDNPSFEDFCSAKETYFCTAKTSFSFFRGFST